MALDVRELEVEMPSPDTNGEGLAVCYPAHVSPYGMVSIAHTVQSVSSGYTMLELKLASNVPNNLVALALQPMELTVEEAEDMREFIAHSTAYPTIPVRNVPEGDRSLLKRRP